MSSNNAFAVNTAEKVSEEFVPFQPIMGSAPAEPKMDQELKTTNESFKIKSNFWESLLNDSWIKKELEKTVEARALSKFKAELESKLSTAIQEGKEEGYKKGYEEGEVQAKKKTEEEFNEVKKKFQALQEEVIGKLNEVANRLHEEKASLLEQHSKLWSSTFSELIDKLPLTGVTGWEKKMEHYFTERLDVFRGNGKAHAFLSNEDYEKVKSSGFDFSKAALSFSMDSELQTGSMRVECNDGGLFFSKQECLERLTKILTETEESN